MMMLSAYRCDFGSSCVQEARHRPRKHASTRYWQVPDQTWPSMAGCKLSSSTPSGEKLLTDSVGTM